MNDRAISYPNGSLSITSIRSSDAGKYDCVATNAGGIITATSYVTVKSKLDKYISLKIIKYCRIMGIVVVVCINLRFHLLYIDKVKD